jgi:hypothetical protein
MFRQRSGAAAQAGLAVQASWDFLRSLPIFRVLPGDRVAGKAVEPHQMMSDSPSWEVPLPNFDGAASAQMPAFLIA